MQGYSINAFAILLNILYIVAVIYVFSIIGKAATLIIRLNVIFNVKLLLEGKEIIKAIRDKGEGV